MKTKVCSVCNKRKKLESFIKRAYSRKIKNGNNNKSNVLDYDYEPRCTACAEQVRLMKEVPKQKKLNALDFKLRKEKILKDNWNLGKWLWLKPFIKEGYKVKWSMVRVPKTYPTQYKSRRVSKSHLMPKYPSKPLYVYKGKKRMKYCKECKKAKEWHYFGKSNEVSHGKHKLCKECISVVRAEWKKIPENREKARISSLKATKKWNKTPTGHLWVNTQRGISLTFTKKGLKKTWQTKYLVGLVPNELHEKMERLMNKEYENRLHRIKDYETLHKAKGLFTKLKIHTKVLLERGKCTWDNYGLCGWGWQVDHKMPRTYFNFFIKKGVLNYEAIIKCFHHSNLQPLWVEENVFIKREKIIPRLLRQHNRYWNREKNKKYLKQRVRLLKKVTQEGIIPLFLHFGKVNMEAV